MQVSVVVASLVGAPFIDRCLASLESEAKAFGAEVIVVACGSKDYAERIARQFPWTRVVHRPERETVPELRRHGVLESKGEIVAIIEEHCTAGKNWLRHAVEGHRRGDYGAVGGPVVDNNYGRLRDWVVYYIEYNGYMPPFAEGEAWDLNGANIAYKRSVLLAHQHLLAGGYWEASLHPALLANKVKFLSLPEMKAHHTGPFDFGYYLEQRYLFSRAFAGSRSKGMPAPKKLAYLAAAPLIPAVLLARIGARVWQKRCHPGKFLLASPLISVALIAYVWGEWIGYLAGPGDALMKVE
ncbi:MAG: glycosyltransferase [Bryobacteraceae bacterium]|nr:glycosyltransferase [Bryobacteraceae bacterium]